MNKEEKLYMMIGTLEYLYSRLKEERKIYKNLYYCLMSYERDPRRKHLMGNNTYEKWKEDFELSKERKNELLRSIALLNEEMMDLDYQITYHSEFDYFREFNY